MVERAEFLALLDAVVPPAEEPATYAAAVVVDA